MKHAPKHNWFVELVCGTAITFLVLSSLAVFCGLCYLPWYVFAPETFWQRVVCVILIIFCEVLIVPATFLWALGWFTLLDSLGKKYMKFVFRRKWIKERQSNDPTVRQDYRNN